MEKKWIEQWILPLIIPLVSYDGERSVGRIIQIGGCHQSIHHKAISYQGAVQFEFLLLLSITTVFCSCFAKAWLTRAVTQNMIPPSRFPLFRFRKSAQVLSPKCQLKIQINSLLLHSIRSFNLVRNVWDEIDDSHHILPSASQPYLPFAICDSSIRAIIVKRLQIHPFCRVHLLFKTQCHLQLTHGLSCWFAPFWWGEKESISRSRCKLDVFSLVLASSQVYLI